MDCHFVVQVKDVLLIFLVYWTGACSGSKFRAVVCSLTADTAAAKVCATPSSKYHPPRCVGEHSALF